MTKREQESEQELDPSKDADEIIQLGEWKPYANRIITSGKWKSYFFAGKLIAYTFRDAPAIEEHQKIVDEKRLSELREMFKPLPSLIEDQKKENDWQRIRHQTKGENDEDEGGD